MINLNYYFSKFAPTKHRSAYSPKRVHYQVYVERDFSQGHIGTGQERTALSWRKAGSDWILKKKKNKFFIVRVVRHRTGCPKRFSLEFKTHMDGSLNNLVWRKVPLPMAGRGWNWRIFKVCSNPNSFMILTKVLKYYILKKPAIMLRK